MRLEEAGRLRLADRVARRLPQWSGTRSRARHNPRPAGALRGLSAWLPLYRDARARAEFEPAIARLALEYAPVDAVGLLRPRVHAARFRPRGCWRASLEQQFAHVRHGLELRFNPPASWRTRIAPTEVDTLRGRLLVGEVHDENAWALGGVAGHAGLFGTAPAVGAFARLVLRTMRGRYRSARPRDAARFVTRSSVPRSSRALGWDTMLPTSSCGSRMSARAFGHTGFTGTSLWIDPEAGVYVALLTNRVHPSRERDGFARSRRAVHDAVMAVLA